MSIGGKRLTLSTVYRLPNMRCSRSGVFRCRHEIKYHDVVLTKRAARRRTSPSAWHRETTMIGFFPREGLGPETNWLNRVDI
jgi:hypothetical protein